MNSQRLFVCLLAGLLPWLPAAASETDKTAADARRGFLHPVSECLDPQRARSWALLESDQVYVDAGRRRYLLDLDIACPELGYAKSISFRTAGGVGRICGYLGEMVLSDTGMNPGRACRISKVHVIPRSAPRIHANQRFLQARAARGFFESRRGDESSSYDVSRRGGD